MMDKRQVNLNDPTLEPSVEDFESLCRAAGDSVRAESAMLAARRLKQEESKHSPKKIGMSFDNN